MLSFLGIAGGTEKIEKQQALFAPLSRPIREDEGKVEFEESVELVKVQNDAKCMEHCCCSHVEPLGLLACLPLELILEWMAVLEAKDVLSLSSVSSLMRSLANDNLLWRRIYLTEWCHGEEEDVLGNEFAKRSLPRVYQLHSWKQLYWLRRSLEKKYITPSANVEENDLPPSVPQQPIQLLPGRERTLHTYWQYASVLRALLPREEDDPVLLEEKRNTSETRALHLICCEEIYSALSFSKKSKKPTEEDFQLLSYWASAVHEFATYQKHYKQNQPFLRYWFRLAAAAYELATSVAPPLEKTHILCSWAGCLRDEANAAAENEEERDALFEAAYNKYHQAIESQKRKDHLLIENWAYAYREHANWKLRSNKIIEMDELFCKCINKYSECARIRKDSIVLSNWADALREWAEAKKGEEQERIFSESDKKYRASFRRDSVDCLTRCNWAMLLVLRARKISDTLRDMKAKLERGEVQEENQMQFIENVEKVVMMENDFQRYLSQAEEHLSYCVAQQDVWSYFCMARLSAVARKETECEEWLKKCKDKCYLHKAKDRQLADFANVKDLPWFKKLQQEQLELFLEHAS